MELCDVDRAEDLNRILERIFESHFDCMNDIIFVRFIYVW